MSPKLSLEETETVIQQSADNRYEWTISTEDPVQQRKYKRLGIEPFYISADGQFKQYKISDNQLTVRRKPKPMPEEQRKARADRLAEIRRK